MSEVKMQETVAISAEQFETKQNAVTKAQNSDMTLVSQKTESAESWKLRENFRFFGSVTLLYACFYAFCMYKNDAVASHDYCSNNKRLLSTDHKCCASYKSMRKVR